MESHTDVIIYDTNKFLPLTHVLLAIAIFLVVSKDTKDCKVHNLKLK